MSSTPTIVHIIDAAPGDRAAISHLLARHGYSPRVYGSIGEFLESGRLQQPVGRACILIAVESGEPTSCDSVGRLIRSGTIFPVIGLSCASDMGIAIDAMKDGAIDFLRKPVSECSVIGAIERAIDCVAGMAARRARREQATARIERLSQRELQILRGLLAGMTNKSIGRRLDLSPRTVEMHRANLMTDLGLASLADAIRLAVEADLAPLEAEDARGASSAEALAPPPLAKPPRRSQGCAPQPLEALLPPVLDVLEGTTDCAFLLDRRFRFTYLNANAAEAIAGGQDLVGEALFDIFPGTRETRAAQFLHDAAEQRKAALFDFYQPDLGCWFRVSVRPIPSGLQVFFRDMSEERKFASAEAETAIIR